MNANDMVLRDERTVAVENESYRWSYLVLSFGLLALAAYRSFAWGESPWDLLLLVVLGGGVGTAYQGTRRILTRQWAASAVVAVVLAAAVAIGVVFFKK